MNAQCCILTTIKWLMANFRSSHKGCSTNTVFLEISQNSQENTCVRISQACNFIKKETLAHAFSCEFCEIFKNTIFIEQLWWLLLQFPNNFWKISNISASMSLDYLTSDLQKPVFLSHIDHGMPHLVGPKTW